MRFLLVVVSALLLAGCLPTTEGSGPPPGWPLVLPAPQDAVVLSSFATDAGDLYFMGTSFGPLNAPDAASGAPRGFVVVTTTEGRLKWFHMFPGRPMVSGAIGPDGEFYGSSYVYGPDSITRTAIEALDREGSLRWEQTFTEFIEPISLAASGSSLFSFSRQSDGGSVIERRNADGGTVQTLAVGPAQTGPLVADAQGTYAWFDRSSLRHFDPSGAELWSLPLPLLPARMIGLPDGTLALFGVDSSGETLDRVSASGALLSSTTFPFSDGNGDLVVDPDGSFFATSVPHKTLYALSADGGARWERDGVSTVVAGPDGWLYVAVAVPGAIQMTRMDRDGGAVE